MALAADLQAQAGELRVDLEQAAAALEGTSARLRELAQGARAQPPETRAYGGSGSRPAGRDARRRKSPKSAKAKAEDEAMLRATRMAMAGSDPKEIASTLRKEFNVRDPDPILDRVLGSGR